MGLPKKGFLMAYVSSDGSEFRIGFPKKEILIDYVIKSCDPPKAKIAGG